MSAAASRPDAFCVVIWGGQDSPRGPLEECDRAIWLSMARTDCAMRLLYPLSPAAGAAAEATARGGNVVG